MTMAEAKDAASVLLLRDSNAGPEVFMVQRHRGNQFMANAHVFVGGRVDEHDGDAGLVQRCRGRTPQEMAALLGEADPTRAVAITIAAIRETFEESGILLAVDRQGGFLDGHAELPSMRDALNNGAIRFVDVLLEHDLYLDLSRLGYRARWITPEFEARRFDARFFLCRSPANQTASHDLRETSAGGWYTVAALLRANLEKQLILAPPTLTILEELQYLRDTDAMLCGAKTSPIEPICPRPLMSGANEITLLLPGDHRYNDPASPSGPEHYVVLRDGCWQRVLR
jgi:8-oxo-dGTP pyrophosphatase MutT (NUDIX family)